MYVVCVPSAGKIMDNVRRKNSAPCKDCKNRKPGCHSGCAEYNEYKLQLECAKRKIYDEYSSQRTFQDLVITGKKKTINRKERR